MRKLLKLTFTFAIALVFMAGATLFMTGTAQAQNNTARIEQEATTSAGLQNATARQDQRGANAGTAFIRQVNTPKGMTAKQDQDGFSPDANIFQNASARAFAYQEQDGNSTADADQISSPDATSRQFQFDSGNYARVLQNEARRSTALQKQWSTGNSAVIIQTEPSTSGGPTGNTAVQLQN